MKLLGRKQVESLIVCVLKVGGWQSGDLAVPNQLALKMDGARATYLYPTAVAEW